MSTVTPSLFSIGESLQKLPPSKWHWDIRHLAETLQITVEQLNGFIKRVESGGSGKKTDSSWEPNSAPYQTPIKLTDNQIDNVLNLHYIDNGRKGSLANSMDIVEPSTSVLEQESRLLRLGRVYTHNNAITPKIQREIVQYVIGTHQRLTQYYPDVAKFRRENWRDWVDGGKNSDKYQIFHLIFIAAEFPDVWDAPVGNTRPEELTPTVLELVKNEVIELLVRMYVLPVSHLPTFVRRSTRHDTIKHSKNFTFSTC